MKKKIFGALLVVAIAAGAMINVNLNKVSNKGNLALASVEALAQAENPSPPGGSSYFRFGTWTYVTVTGASIAVTVDVIVKGVKVGTKIEYKPGESYSMWDCKGWNGNC